MLCYTEKVQFLRANKKFIYAVAVLVGSIIGVGIFGMPFAFAKAGFGIGFAFLVPITLIVLLVYTMYGEVVLRTEAKHQLTGYTKKYLGVSFQRIIFFSSLLTAYAGLLAYIIIAGDFLNTIFSPVLFAASSTYSIVFFVLVSLLVLRGLKTVSWVDLVFTSLYVVVIVLIFIFGFDKIHLINLKTYTPEYAFLPYGVLLFAFGGLLGVPIQREMLIGKEHLMRKAITTSILAVAGLYFLFTFTVVGISGDVTSPDAISGLFEFLGSNVTYLGAIFGILAITTAFLMLASGLIEMFNFDFKVPRSRAWLFAIVPPLL
ncbi:hypothetical protein KW791_02340, partial [Candidatus Parcubacteria bacterium]|nr:hypothetical protein [Candidatus Parcubacteria bacterium]